MRQWLGLGLGSGAGPWPRSHACRLTDLGPWTEGTLDNLEGEHDSNLVPCLWVAPLGRHRSFGPVCLAQCPQHHLGDLLRSLGLSGIPLRTEELASQHMK